METNDDDRSEMTGDPLLVLGAPDNTISRRIITVAPSSEAIASKVLRDASISARVRPMTVPSSTCQLKLYFEVVTNEGEGGTYQQAQFRRWPHSFPASISTSSELPIFRTSLD